MMTTFVSSPQFGRRISSLIDAEFRINVACTIGIYAVMYVLIRLIP